MSDQDVIEAHKLLTNNRSLVETSRICGCCYCLRIFPAKKVIKWVKKESKTAVCPHCNIDAILPYTPRFPVGNDILKQIRDRYFMPPERRNPK